MNTDIIKQFTDLYEEREAARRRLKEIEDALETAENAVMQTLLNEGVDNVTVNGRTVSLARKFYASASGTEAIDALLGAGMKDFLLVGHQRFGALMRERLEASRDKAAVAGTEAAWTIEQGLEEVFKDIPQLRGLVKAGEKWELRSRKA